MEVYRITKTKYAKSINGFGAEKFGGRWNSKGVAMLYTSQSRALAMTEVAVHLSYGIMPKDFSLVTIEIPNNTMIEELKIEDLPKNWDNIPHNGNTQLIGDDFVSEQEYLALKVPSVIVKGDFNFLINPLHKDFDKIKIKNIEPFLFDNRLFVNN
ncbi:MAG: RES family NAD+ phosphorylase [Chitinophagales bacterium]|nr:RES family NAD+ phosphorylase [Chitinophagales bacterium]